MLQASGGSSGNPCWRMKFVTTGEAMRFSSPGALEHHNVGSLGRCARLPGLDEYPNLLRADIETLARLRAQGLELLAGGLDLDRGVVSVGQLELDHRPRGVHVAKGGPEAAARPLVPAEVELVGAGEAGGGASLGLRMAGIVHGERAEERLSPLDPTVKHVDVAHELHDEGRGGVVEDL